MIAKALAVNGAKKIYIVGRRKDVLEAAAKESPHGNIVPLVGDVTSKESLQSVVDFVQKDEGFINVLVANSGIAGPQVQVTPETSLADFQKKLWEVEPAEYSNTFIVNTTSAWYTAIAFLGLLDEGNKRSNVEQKSQVIVTSSIAGFNRKAPGGYAYGQSKAATTHLVKQLSVALIPYDIRANTLAPGCKFSILVLFNS
jgi:NAD(P)-dependent dehydrogenase (short-subunit alcohol dehydrogenase family)